MIRTYSDSDIKALINYYSGKSYLQVRNKTMIMLLVETGIRNSERRNVKLEDVYDDVIKVSGEGKTWFVPISIHFKKQLKVHACAKGIRKNPGMSLFICIHGWQESQCRCSLRCTKKGRESCQY